MKLLTKLKYWWFGYRPPELSIEDIVSVQPMSGPSTSESLKWHVMTPEESEAYNNLDPYSIRDGGWFRGNWHRLPNNDVIDKADIFLREEGPNDVYETRISRVWRNDGKVWEEPTPEEQKQHHKTYKQKRVKIGNFSSFKYPVILSTMPLYKRIWYKLTRK